MITKLIRHGDEYALVIDKSIINSMNIDLETPLEITADGHSTTIVPARDADIDDKIAKASKIMHSKYAETFRLLAE